MVEFWPSYRRIESDAFEPTVHRGTGVLKNLGFFSIWRLQISLNTRLDGIPLMEVIHQFGLAFYEWRGHLESVPGTLLFLFQPLKIHSFVIHGSSHLETSTFKGRKSLKSYSQIEQFMAKFYFSDSSTVINNQTLTKCYIIPIEIH